MTKVALFLGAGASRAFGYPTTLEFVNELKKTLGILEKNLLNSILKSPKVSDIEHVLQTLDPILEPNSIAYLSSVLKGSKISTETLGAEADWGLFISRCEVLKQGIITELFGQYEFDSTKLGKIIDCYTELYSIFYGVNQLNELYVFTTNYDLIP